jgi:hypothetical protein
MTANVNFLAGAELADGKGAGAERNLSEPAKRALAEAAARRAHQVPQQAPERGGRDGLDPVRYGDWELNGIAVDF